MLIDTHCHLDAAEFDQDRKEVIAQSVANGVSGIVIPSVTQKNLSAVQQLAWAFDGGYYALGIHPMYVRYARDEDLAAVDCALQKALLQEDKRLVAVGEIGLDFFIPDMKIGKERQEYFYREQLKLARQYGLPVLLHVRRSQDTVLKHLRQIQVMGGIAHAFNGSEQQAQAFMDLGFCLGFGGTLTFSRASNIRRLAGTVDLNYVVLETDAPDMPPAWLTAANPRNSPVFLPRIAQVLAQLRGISLEEVARITSENARRVLPRLGM